MVDSLSVDPAALRDAATRLTSLAAGIPSSALGGQSMPSLLALQGDLPGSQTGSAAVDLGRAVAQLAAEVVTAVDGLATGLRVAADTYHQVDVVSGAAARELAGHQPAGPPSPAHG